MPSKLLQNEPVFLWQHACTRQEKHWNWSRSDSLSVNKAKVTSSLLAQGKTLSSFSESLY